MKEEEYLKLREEYQRENYEQLGDGIAKTEAQALLKDTDTKKGEENFGLFWKQVDFFTSSQVIEYLDAIEFLIEWTRNRDDYTELNFYLENHYWWVIHTWSFYQTLEFFDGGIKLSGVPKEYRNRLQKYSYIDPDLVMLASVCHKFKSNFEKSKEDEVGEQKP